ncbi:MAG: hypothetical protein P8H03_11175, partial [Emcibacteraceae bacterium]|nr:hypothetical protein [Emcibacteraceae bacterium]
EWSSIASMGMQSMMSAIGLINETLDGSDLEPFVVEHLQPSEEVIESWRHEVKVVLIRDFLLGVVEGEVVG